MPQVKTKTVKTTRKTIKPSSNIRNNEDVKDIIMKLADFEQKAFESKIDFASGRYKLLTNSERDYLRAELIADVIRLTAGNTGQTPVFFDTSLFNFCAKITDMEIPSNELLGTYLAALEIVREDNIEEKIPGFDALMQTTMKTILNTCLEMLANRITSAEKKI